MKSVAILRETRDGERRVILKPPQVRLFHEAGFRVLVEHAAGAGLEISDRAYEQAGAEIVSTNTAWTGTPLVLKYKAPLPPEFDYFRPNLHLGAYLHAEGNPALTLALCHTGVTAYSYELFRTSDGIFPMSVASSEIAGKMAVLYAAYHLQAHLGGAGVLLAGMPNIKPPKVVVIGYGNVGGAAVRLAAAVGAEVVALGTNPARLRRFAATVPASVRCLISTPDVLARELPDADVVIGAILISTYDTPPIVTEQLVQRMKCGAVLVDVTCGYGAGYLPTCDPFTTHHEPTIDRYGVLHIKIKTLPESVPVTTNEAVSSLIAPYLLTMAHAVYGEAVDPISTAGKVTEGGEVIHPEVRRHMEMQPCP
jgi:alanine dehydrogenase